MAPFISNAEAAATKLRLLMWQPYAIKETIAEFESSTGALLLTAEGCDDLGGDNLLFYTPPVTDLAQRTLSPDQAWALDRNPSVL